MCRRKAVVVGVWAVLSLLNYVQGEQYFPSECAGKCQSLDDYQVAMPAERGSMNSRVAEWSIMALNLIKKNLDNTSPPGIGRALAIFSTCMYEATTLFDEDLVPYTSKQASKGNAFDSELINRAIDGAASRALQVIFGRFGNVDGVDEFLREKTRDDEEIKSPSTEFPEKYKSEGLTATLAMNAGQFACDRVIKKFTFDGYDGLGDFLDDSSSGFTPVNTPQTHAGITNCPTEMQDLSRWQPLCVPRAPTIKGNMGSTDCDIQEWLAPTAGAWNTFAIERGLPFQGKDLINGVAKEEPMQGEPPAYGEGDQWEKQWVEVMQASASLDDPQKMISEFWADGPDTTAPPGTWFLFAINAAQTRDLGIQDTVKLLMLVGNALNDAGVGAWRVKVAFDSIRPIQMIQCGSSEHGARNILAWKGPYQGVGLRPAATWQPYQQDTFITPSFAGYVSGHSTFSAAAAEVLKLYFGSDEFVGPKCVGFEEGNSLFEKKIAPGQPGYIPGMTDVPNKGKDTVGYSPRSKVTLCWDTFSEAAHQSSESRIYGGVHVRADADDGLALGRHIGRAVFRDSVKMFGKPENVGT